MPYAVIAFRALVLSCLLFAGHLAVAASGESGLWVGEAGGLLKIGGADGGLLLTLNEPRDVRAIAFDERSGWLWVYSSGELTALDQAGVQQQSFAVNDDDRDHCGGHKDRHTDCGGRDRDSSRGGHDNGPVALAADSHQGGVWLARDKTLHRYGTDGTPGASVDIDEEITALAFDPAQQRLWVASESRLRALDADGAWVATAAVPRKTDIVDIAYDPTFEGVWLVSKKSVDRYDADGRLLGSRPFKDAEAVAADGRGNAWVASRKRLYRLNGAGTIDRDLQPFPHKGESDQPVLAADPADGAIWIAAGRQLAHFDETGQPRPAPNLRDAPRPVGPIAALALAVDRTAPQVALTAPPDGAFIATERPELGLEYSDSGEGVDGASIRLTVGGQDWPLDCAAEAARATCTPVDPLPQGPLALAVTVDDRAGNRSPPAAANITIDTLAPALMLAEPADGLWSNAETLTVVGAVDEPAALEVNGVAVALDAQYGFRHALGLVEGSNVIIARATDRAGNLGTLSRTVYRDSAPPQTVDIARVAVGEEGAQAVVSGTAGSAEADARVAVTNTRSGETVTVVAGADGAFTVRIGVLAGDPLAIVVSDRAGNRSGEVVVHTGPSGGTLPPDPATVAPPVDPTVPTSVYAATRFLYAGSRPIQTGVAPDTIEAHRTAVLRGQVMDRSGAPLSGVTLSIKGHPEYGQTLSRADGLFDLVVNGGGPLTLDYRKDGYLPAQRQVEARWQDYAWLPEVTLVGLDPNVTEVAFGAASAQVARGGESSDADGTRRATLLLPAGTTATLTLADGTVTPLSVAHVRATEYTVGAAGPSAMPGELPPSSGYTYAVELSMDEALAAGATRVDFSRPVPFYLENFLNFPVGGAVPAGWYDRERAVWVPSANGRIVRVLTVDAGLAQLDVDGSGQPADAAALAALGIDAAERAQLAALYAPGASLWRVPIPHLTPWDFNWPFDLPFGALPPDVQLLLMMLLTDPSCQSSSIIECQNQALGETIPVEGTPFSLNYRSSRVPGHAASYTIDIPLTTETVPPNVLSVELEVLVAGKRFTESFAPAPNRQFTFTWDGRDAYGSLMQGIRGATVRVGYTYRGVYGQPVGAQAFGAAPGRELSGSTARQTITLWQSRVVPLGTVANPAQLGLWTLDMHHVYEPTGGSLYEGNGRRRAAGETGKTLSTVAGSLTTWDDPVDGAHATDVFVSLAWGLEVGADGSVYFGDDTNRVRRVRPDGILDTVAGNGSVGYSGDGGPALDARLRNPRALSAGADGSLYILDDLRVRRVGPNGLIRTVAGNGSVGTAPEVAIATNVPLDYPKSVHAAADGSLYIAEQGARVRKVDANGILTTVAGSGRAGCGGDGGPAREATLTLPFDVATGPDGSLYIADASCNTVRRVGLDGIIHTVAGNGQWQLEAGAVNGSPATTIAIGAPFGIDVSPEGILYIASGDFARVIGVGADGTAFLVAGNGQDSWSAVSLGDNGPALQAATDANDVAIGPDGGLLIADYNGVRRLRVPFPFWGFSETLIASDRADEVYRFDATGRHLATHVALTGAERYRFGYDVQGRLASVTDGDGNRTAIERTVGGAAIVGPDGQRTELAFDTRGYLISVTNPAGESYRLEYLANGLLSGFTDRRGSLSRFTYDERGNLRRDENALGGGWTLAASSDPYETVVTMTSAEGLTTTYYTGGTSGVDRDVMVVLPDGTVRETYDDVGEGRGKLYVPDGSVEEYIRGPDPRFGLQAPLERRRRISTQNGTTGLTKLIERTRSVELADPTDPFSVSRQVETTAVNGRAYTQTYEAATHTSTTTTPAGRVETQVLDGQGRTLQRQRGTLEPLHFDYDSRGRLIGLREGERLYALAYDGQGHLDSITDPLGHTRAFDYDAVGRLLRQYLPDGRSIGYVYDANDNLTALVPPGRSAHRFEYDAVDEQSAYTPPPLEGVDTLTRYRYDLDKRLTTVERPDGQTVRLGYAAGKLESLTLPGGSVRYEYDPWRGQVVAIETSDGVRLDYRWDGNLLLEEGWSGPVSAAVARRYDSDLRVVEQTVDGEAVGFAYDADGLLTGAGDLSLERDAATGLVTGTHLGAVTTERTYDAFGDIAHEAARVGDTLLYAVDYTRDAIGRISERRETADGVTTTWGYRYDEAGRLVEVRANGAVSALYAYDGNGNRLSRSAGGSSETGSYDAQDRMVGYAGAGYTYTANGELLSRSENGQTTTYDYDVLGNLRRVVLADGTVVEYLIDGRNRRIGRKVDGVLVQGWVYEDALEPVAELDGQGNVVARFVYGEKANVPAYMVKDGKTYRVVSDHLGSVRRVVDSVTGEVVQRLDYDEFGRVVQDSHPGFQPFGFVGGLADPLTGLVRFGARDYDARTGRWTAKDPIDFAGGDTNLFAYVRNDSVNFMDPRGLLYVAIRVEVSNTFIVVHQSDDPNDWGPPAFVGIFVIDNAPCNFLCGFGDKEFNDYYKPKNGC